MKAVIAIPSEPVARAGGRELRFESLKDAAAFFGTAKAYISYSINNPPATERKPYCGYYFDFATEEND